MDEITTVPGRLTGKDEMNLADFAIGVIRLSGDKEDHKTSLTRSQTIKTKQGLLKQEWIVTASGQYGFPQPADDDILLGLIHLASEENFSHQTVSFSRYALCKLMGWVNKGKNYERIEAALHRLTGIRINAKQSFYDSGRKEYVSKVFGVIDSFQISSQRGRLSFARLSDDLWASIQCNNIKPIDLATYYGLRSPIARRLYRFLDKRRLNRSSFELELESLAQVNIGLSSSTRVYPSQFKQTLSAPHRELEKIGFLSSVNYVLGNNKAWRVRYTFQKESQSKEALAPTPVALDFVNEIEATSGATSEEQALIQRGISAKVASALAAEHAARLPDLLDFYDFVMRKRPGYWSNPVGWLVQAIREDYTIPKDFLDYVPRKKRELLEADKRRAAQKIQEREEREQKLEQFRHQRLEALSKEERAELSAFVRSESTWMAKLAPDHPALRGALIDALESGTWRAFQQLQLQSLLKSSVPGVHYRLMT